MKALWNGVVIADSNKTVKIEGNDYFPPESVRSEYFVNSDTHSTCPWKGLASYKSLNVKGSVNKDSVWFYPEPKDAAEQIRGYFAFWKGVEIREE